MPLPRLLILADGYVEADVLDLTRGSLDVTVKTGIEMAEFKSLVANCDALMPTLRLKVDAGVIAAAKRLKVVATNTTGLDHLDLKEMERHGITLYSLKHDREFLETITTTAELAFGLLLACARRLPECFESTRRGEWGRHLFAGTQLREKTLGIVGVGRLGTMMARYGLAFGMRVLGTDPTPLKVPTGVEMVSMAPLLAESDFVSLHVHLTDATRHLLGPKELASMKRGAVLLNTSRGGLVDEGALIREMRSGRIAAAGLDVIDGEWLEDKRNHPLIAYSRENPRLLITPHVGGTSPDATRASVRHMVAKVVEHFREHPLNA
ncbi:MAG: NAD(P)-dependent oxidoreductase [Verrucomicrobiia bacterium]